MLAIRRSPAPRRRRPSASVRHPRRIDILVADGRIAVRQGPRLRPPRPRLDGAGAFVSPGWVDLHAHVWYGGTDISIRPQQCGARARRDHHGRRGLGGGGQFSRLSRIRHRARARAHRRLPQHRLDRPGRLQPGQRAHRHPLDRHRPHAGLHRGQPGRDPSASRCARATSSSAPGASRRSRSPRRWPRSRAAADGACRRAAAARSTRCSRSSARATSSPTASTASRAATSSRTRTCFALAERCAAAGVRLDVGHGGASFSFKVAERRSGAGCMPLLDLDRPAPALPRQPGLGHGHHHVEAPGRRHAVREVVARPRPARARVVGLPTEGLCAGARARNSPCSVCERLPSRSTVPRFPGDERHARQLVSSRATARPAAPSPSRRAASLSLRRAAR